MTEAQGHIASYIIDGLLWAAIMFILYRIGKEEGLDSIKPGWYPDQVRDTDEDPD